jgi:PleD family two-component response regulator
VSAQLTSESGLQAPRRVLLIQPDTHALSRDSQALQGGGYQVVPAETALDGLKRLYEDPPQLVIVAEQLGAMNGYQLSRLIKHDLAIKHIPVVMIGQSNSSLHKYWQFQAGLDGFIEADEHTNTYDPQALCEQADALLGIYESMDQRCITPQAAKVTLFKID